MGQLPGVDFLRFDILIPFSTVKATVVDNSDGSYGVSYTPVAPGLYSVWVCVKTRHVKVRRPTTESAHQGHVVKTLNILILSF